VAEDLRPLLFDPQTAGGLLISTPDGARVLEKLKAAGVPAAEVGDVLENQKPRIHVVA